MKRSIANIVIIGAGINGVCIARRLGENENFQVTIIDKEISAGYHASTRNSGVIHAGFYYSPESEKAKLCSKGNQLMREYCINNKIKTNRCGKIVVTRDEKQEEILFELYKRSTLSLNVLADS